MNRFVGAIVGLAIGAGVGCGSASGLKASETPEPASVDDGEVTDVTVAELDAMKEARDATSAAYKASSAAYKSRVAEVLGTLLGQACLESQGCSSNGECGYVPPLEFEAIGHCAPTIEAHCSNSMKCEWHGGCGLVMDDEFGLHRCMPTEDRHCLSAQVCKRTGRCARVGDLCVEA